MSYTFLVRKKLFIFFPKNKSCEKIYYVSGNRTFQPQVQKASYISRKGTFLYFLKKMFFLYFGKWNTLYLRRWKRKTNRHSEKNFSPSLKKPLLFQEGTYKTWKSKVSCISFHFFCLLEARRKKLSCTFPYKEERFSKLKYFLMIIIKHFFSFYIFSILRNLLSFILWWIYDHSRPYCCFSS